MKIFLVEDNKDLNNDITKLLIHIGYDVVSSCDGAEAFELVEASYDLYIIDINIPNINGLELVKKIKSFNTERKIFIISGDDNIDTILQAYDLGVDDYIKKPFDLREIIAKIKITFQNKLETQIKLCDKCIFIRDEKLLYCEDKLIKLTKKERLFLSVLIDNMNDIVTYDKIEEVVWENKSSNGHIRQLLSKLKKDLPCKDIIETYPSTGYMLKLD